MKRIEYISPVDYIRGNISGRQSLTYGVGETPAYGAPSGEKTAANDYQPRLVAKVAHIYKPWRIKYFQVRTRSSINMTAAVRNNLALMGGTGALIGSLLTMKETAIYRACIAAKPKQVTLRAFLAPIIRDALANKDEYIVVAPDVHIVNPWVSSAEPNVPVPTTIINKFDSILGNHSESPYSANATAALVTAFPMQWETIRQYGLQHPEIVGYMNAYAPEDPNIAYSLVEGIGYRTLAANGTSYFDTGVICNQDTISRYFGYVLAEFGSGATHMAGAGSRQFIYGFYNGARTSWDDYNDDYDLGSHFGNTWMPSGWHEIYKEKNKLYIDGQLIRTATAATFITETLAILAVHYSDKYERIAIEGNKFAKLELSSNGQNYWFVPIKRNGVMECIDLVSGNLAIRVGSFTEQIETPAN